MAIPPNNDGVPPAFARKLCVGFDIDVTVENDFILLQQSNHIDLHQKIFIHLRDAQLIAAWLNESANAFNYQ